MRLTIPLNPSLVYRVCNISMKLWLHVDNARVKVWWVKQNNRYCTSRVSYDIICFKIYFSSKQFYSFWYIFCCNVGQMFVNLYGFVSLCVEESCMSLHCTLYSEICYLCVHRYMWTDVSVFQYLMFESFNKTSFSMIDRSICSYVKYSKTSLLFMFLKLLLCDVPMWKKFCRQLN